MKTHVLLFVMIRALVEHVFSDRLPVNLRDNNFMKIVSLAPEVLIMINSYAFKEVRIKMHVKKGDKVMVISGKDKGKTGVILAAFPKKDRVLVEGVNIVKKHAKAFSSESTRWNHSTKKHLFMYQMLCLSILKQVNLLVLVTKSLTVKKYALQKNPVKSLDK